VPLGDRPWPRKSTSHAVQPRLDKTPRDHPEVDAATEDAMQERDRPVGTCAIQSIEYEINTPSL